MIRPTTGRPGTASIVGMPRAVASPTAITDTPLRRQASVVRSAARPRIHADDGVTGRGTSPASIGRSEQADDDRQHGHRGDHDGDQQRQAGPGRR